MKDLLASIPKKARPYALLVLVLIPILAVWATYDDVVRQQAAEIERLRQGQTAPASGVPGPSKEPAVAPSPTGGSGSGAATPFAAPTTSWRTAVSPDGAFEVSLPPGTKLLQGEGVTYVMADPTPASALPIMVIKQPSAPDKQGYKPGTPTSVMMTIGTQTWWLYTWQYKPWDPFTRVVSSFKLLK